MFCGWFGSDGGTHTDRQILSHFVPMEYGVNKDPKECRLEIYSPIFTN